MANQSDTAHQRDYTIINIRKLAALDMVFHHPRLILGEFVLGVFGSIALALVVALPGLMTHLSFTQLLVSSYMLAIALNYLPLLLHAISLTRRKSAADEVAFELARKERYARMYTAQSVLLLLPLVTPILALYQARQR